jgi:hypothetical protein
MHINSASLLFQQQNYFAQCACILRAIQYCVQQDSPCSDVLYGCETLSCPLKHNIERECLGRRC